jgi:hypothetical protein
LVLEGPERKEVIVAREFVWLLLAVRVIDDVADRYFRCALIFLSPASPAPRVS